MLNKNEIDKIMEDLNNSTDFLILNIYNNIEPNQNPIVKEYASKIFKDEISNSLKKNPNIALDYFINDETNLKLNNKNEETNFFSELYS